MTSHLGVLLLILGGLLYSVGDVFMRFWVDKTSETSWFIIGFLFYIVGLGCLSYSYLFKDIAIAGLMIVLFNTAFIIVFNYLYFGDHLNTMQWIGIGLAFISLAFLELS